MKITTEVYVDNGATLKEKRIHIREVVPPDRTYVLSTNEANGVTKKIEFIGIGEKIFVRKDEGKWEVYNPETEQSGGSSTGVGAISNVKLLEETTFNGQPVKVYYEEDSTYSDAGDFNSVKKYWFTTEGELLKIESERKNLKTREIFREVTLYEYDADIKIEAPIK